jgi:predicted nuclease with TOPRIM domain
MMTDKLVEGAKTYGMYALLVLTSLTATFLGIQWQQTEAAVENLERNVARIDSEAEAAIDKLETQFRQEISRLDESNRTRRNDIADLEERIARLEERTGG